MATGSGRTDNQMALAPPIQRHRHFRKRLVNNAGQKAFKMTVLSNLVKSHRDQQRIPDTDSSLNPTEPYFTPPSACLPEAPIERKSKLCSSRAAAITFCIVVAIVLVAAISIGIIFGTMGSQFSNGSGSNTMRTTNNPNTLSTSAFVGLTSSVNIGSQTGPPCSAYTTIDDPSRNVNQGGSSQPCDDGPIFNSSSGRAWIRFVGTGGTMIATTAVPVNHCGGFFGLWYNGSLPTTPGTTENGTICGNSYSFTCMRQEDTQVVLCPGSPNFYIYALHPVRLCNTRYCTT